MAPEPPWDHLTRGSSLESKLGLPARRKKLQNSDYPATRAFRKLERGRKQSRYWLQRRFWLGVAHQELLSPWLPGKMVKRLPLNNRGWNGTRAWAKARALEGILAVLRCGRSAKLPLFSPAKRIDNNRQERALKPVQAPELVHPSSQGSGEGLL